MKTLLQLCFLINIVPAPLHVAAQSNAKKQLSDEVVTTQVDTIRKLYKKVLIAGIGAIPTRHFLENLSPLLIERFNKEQITCIYEFLGSKREELDSKLKACVQQHQPDIALVIYQPESGPDTLANKQRRELLYQLLISPQKRQRVVNPRKAKLEEDLQAVLWEQADNKVV